MEKLFVFHGVDHKVGTTMISQSVAEHISNSYPDLKVLFMTLNGRESAEYVRETPQTIEGIKIHIDNKILDNETFKRSCKKTESLYMLAGILNESEERFYYPDTVRYLLDSVIPEFNIIIIDSGNEIDNGLAFGSLVSTNNRFLLISQQESVIKRWEKLRTIYEKLGISFENYIINKYYEEDPYGLSYIADRLELSKSSLVKVEGVHYARRAEMDYKTLLEYRNDKYNENIEEISNLILNRIGRAINKKQRKNKWISFI